MLSGMRDRTGGPRARYRVLALVVAVGLLVAAAPLVLSLLTVLLDGLRG
jgi:hypothetical protein